MEQALGVADLSHFAAHRLHIVTGKGGTGKTTVAAALALALATEGRRVLLMEVEARQGIAQLFDVPPLPYEERKIAVARGNGEVHALAVDPEEALLEYLDIYYNLRRAGRMLKRLGAVDFATTIAPGMRDVLLTGKIKDAFASTTGPDRRSGPLRYDSIVVDAPPTGRIAAFLHVNEEVADLARMGPIRGQAESVMTILRSPQTAIHVVTLLEEMPVQETLDAVDELRAIKLPVGAVIVNMFRTPLMDGDDLDRAEGRSFDLDRIAGALESVGLGGGGRRTAGAGTSSQALAKALAEEGAEHAERVRLERSSRERLSAARAPVAELPLLPEAVDLGGLYYLSRVFEDLGINA